ncbi:MAG: hypothetical protein ACI39F_05705 [Acutalibacteraceae bacterium]
MFFVVGFFAVTFFNIGFFLGCFWNDSKKRRRKKKKESEVKEYKPSRKEQNLIDDLNFLNSFTGEERK